MTILTAPGTENNTLPPHALNARLAAPAAQTPSASHLVNFPTVAAPQQPAQPAHPAPASMQPTRVLSDGLSQWSQEDRVVGVIAQALGNCGGLDKRGRLLARVRSATEELGIRIAEYEDYARTAEGRSEEMRARAQSMRHEERGTSSSYGDDTMSH